MYSYNNYPVIYAENRASRALVYQKSDHTIANNPLQMEANRGPFTPTDDNDSAYFTISMLPGLPIPFQRGHNIA